MTKAVLISVTALTFVACHTAPRMAPEPALKGNYVLDPTHASITWSLSHAGLSNYTARFDRITGTLLFDPTAPEKSRVDIRIDPNSVSTGLPEFDNTLATSPKYFNSKAFPEIRFVTKSVKPLTGHTGLVTGDLTFRGRTKPVTLNVTYNGAGKSFGKPGDTLGFSATGTLKRSGFDLTHLVNFGIGDDVTLRIEVEFNEVKS